MHRTKFLFSIAILLIAALANPLNAQKKDGSQKNTVDTCTGKGVVIQSLGASTYVVLYNTFLGIGSIVDGNLQGIYEDQLTIGLIDDQLRMINLVDTSYAKLLQTSFVSGAEDRKFIEGARGVLGNLYAYANNYKFYVNDKSPANKLRFEESRDKAWGSLSALLGL